MKHFISFLFLIIPLISVGQDIQNLYFLEGNWQSSEGDFRESWQIANDGTLSGTGITLENGDTISNEDLRITEIGGKLVYIAYPEGQEPVMFTLVDTAGSVFRFENASHDFPQMINYERRGADQTFIQVSNLAGEGFGLEMNRVESTEKVGSHGPLLKNDAVVLGLLMLILGFVFYTSSLKTGFWAKFYSRVPALLLCYFIPGIFNSLGIISGEESGLYKMASRYLLPASLLLLCIGIDFKGIIKLGPKALIMFFTATVSIIIGGPIALWIGGIIHPELLTEAGNESAFRGLSTIAGSWIGGGANQAAMKEVFKPSDELFSIMVAVDVLVANLWMAVLLLGAGNTKKVDNWLKADSSAIESLKKKLSDYQAATVKLPTLKDTMIILAVAFGGVGVSHFFADILAPWLSINAPVLEKFSLTSPFFWIVVIATTVGLLLSFTRVRNLESVGASRLGSAFLYILVATIGMNMDITAITSEPLYFLIGLIWVSIHAVILISMARLIKAPIFYAAVGSQANIGGAASAPVVASAFHPALAPVGVLLAVFGYALGTYGAWLCGILMQSLTQ